MSKLRETWFHDNRGKTVKLISMKCDVILQQKQMLHIYTLFKQNHRKCIILFDKQLKGKTIKITLDNIKW